MPGGHSKGLARRILLYDRRVRQAKLVGGLAGFFEQLDISHGSPRDERSPGVVFFGIFFFDCFYGDSTGVVFDQPSIEATPSREPHGYSLSIPLLRQVSGQRASPVRLHSTGILPIGPAPTRSRPLGAGLKTLRRRPRRYFLSLSHARLFRITPFGGR